MPRPKIFSPCVADRHVSNKSVERIAEFSTTNGLGGLISLREFLDGTAALEVYRVDDGVQVVVDLPSERIVGRDPRGLPAAPDLLGMVERLLAHHREVTDTVTEADVPDWFDTLREAESMIARARGSSNGGV